MRHRGKSLAVCEWSGAGLGSGPSEEASQERRSAKDAQSARPGAREHATAERAKAGKLEERLQQSPLAAGEGFLPHVY